MARDLRKALAGGGLALHYQKRVALNTRRAVGAEALLRWHDRRRGVVPPATFLPLLDRISLGPQVDAWVLASACQTAASWPGRPVVSVNITARQLHGGVLLRQVSAALENAGQMSPGCLELELSERTILEAGTDSLLALAALRDLGVSLALDNFGAVHGSLPLLKRLPLSVVKVDRSLIHGLPDHRDDVAIVNAVIQASHDLELTVVAEGIENEAQLALLTAIGCDQGQGYLFGLPGPPEQLLPDLHTAEPAGR